MYDRSIHLWCLTYDRPPKHKKTASNYKFLDLVQWHCCGYFGTGGSMHQNWGVENYCKGWVSSPPPGRSGLCPNQGGIFRPAAAKLNWADICRSGPSLPGRSHHLAHGERNWSAVGTRIYRDALMEGQDSFPLRERWVSSEWGGQWVMGQKWLKGCPSDNLGAKRLDASVTSRWWDWVLGWPFSSLLEGSSQEKKGRLNLPKTLCKLKTLQREWKHSWMVQSRCFHIWPTP